MFLSEVPYYPQDKKDIQYGKYMNQTYQCSEIHTRKLLSDDWERSTNA